jgi:hypothetical protein
MGKIVLFAAAIAVFFVIGIDAWLASERSPRARWLALLLIH